MDLIFTICLIETLLPSLPVFPAEPSTTRQLTLVYLLVGVTLIAAPWRRVPRREWLLVLAVALMPVVGLLVWTSTLGTDIGSSYWSGWHPWITITGFLPFAVAYGSARWRYWRRILIALATGAALLQAMIMASWFLGASHTETSTQGDFYGVRPLTANLALLMLFGFVLLVTEEPGSRSRGTLALFLGISVVLAQHRSAWASLIVVLLLLTLRGVRQRHSGLAWAPVTGTAAFLATVLLLPLTTRISVLPVSSDESTGEPGLPDVATSTHSLEWRFEMWRSRLAASRSLSNTVFGGVFQVTPVKLPGVGVMNPGNSAHNMAVDIYTMLGLVGLLIVGLLVLVALVARADRLDAFAIMLWGLLVYGFFYNWPEWTWLIVGVALANRRLATVTFGRADDDEHDQPLPDADATGDRTAVRASLSRAVLPTE